MPTSITQIPIIQILAVWKDAVGDTNPPISALITDLIMTLLTDPTWISGACGLALPRYNLILLQPCRRVLLRFLLYKYFQYGKTPWVTQIH